MSVSDNSVNPAWSGRSYFMVYCNNDFNKVNPIATKMYEMGLRVDTSYGLDYIQRAEKIRDCDVVIFFLSKNLFQTEPFETNQDYEYCESFGKIAHFVHLDNINKLHHSSMSTKAYAFLVKIKEFQGITLKTSLNDAEQTREILEAIDNPHKNEIKASKAKYVPIVLLLAAAAVMYLFAIFKGNFPFPSTSDTEQPTLPLETFSTAKNLAVGRHVTFGSYEQDGNTANGSEVIEWIVLDKQNDKVLLISDKLLDYVPYNEEAKAVTWSNCSLRNWLNNDFYTTAFAPQERAKIALSNNSNPANSTHKTDGGKSTNDRVFSLSADEAQQYFSSGTAMAAYTTEFARRQGYAASSDGKDYWWLRTPGQSGEYAMDVAAEGGIVTMGNSVTNNSVAIRPAVWVTVG